MNPLFIASDNAMQKKLFFSTVRATIRMSKIAYQRLLAAINLYGNQFPCFEIIRMVFKRLATVDWSTANASAGSSCV